MCEYFTVKEEGGLLQTKSYIIVNKQDFAPLMTILLVLIAHKVVYIVNKMENVFLHIIIIVTI